MTFIGVTRPHGGMLLRFGWVVRHRRRNRAQFCRVQHEADEASIAVLAESVTVLRRAVVLTTAFLWAFRIDRVSVPPKFVRFPIVSAPPDEPSVIARELARLLQKQVMIERRNK